MSSRTHNHYETADEYQAEAYSVADYPGVAFYVRGWETQPDEDTDWSGCEDRTGNLVVTMIGDDRKFSVDPAEVSAIADDAFCPECGQIGCGHGR